MYYDNIGDIVKYIIIILSLIINIDVFAENSVKSENVIKCGKKYYALYLDEWYHVKNDNNKWIIVSSSDTPPCFIDKPNEREKVLFSKCVDGDTAKLIVDGQERFVRFLAIDTPESVKPETEVEYMGKEASEFTCNRLKNAQEIILEYDNHSGKYDKFDRILAFVYVDNKMLQEELVEKGYAKLAYVYDDYSHIVQLEELERLAKEKRLGIWNEEGKNLPSTSETFWEKILSLFDEVYTFLVNLFA